MRLLRRTPILSAALAVSLLAMGASAQSAAATDLPNLSTATQTNGKTTAATNTAKNTNTNTGAQPSITGGTTGTNTGKLPSITGGTTGTNTDALPTLPSNLPTLTGIATIVTPIVPNTKQAPFMQQSNLPDGTVFIVVGAILGFMAMSVLLWRGLVAWSLHRSVKRAALAQHIAMNDTKPLFRTPGNPTPTQVYKYTDRDSTMSPSHKLGKKGPRISTAGVGGGTTASNLFFSPTAGAATASLANVGNRGSNYLPAGYYAAGAAQAGGHQQPPISLSTLSQAPNYPRPTPPDSPAYGGSSSTLNLNQGYGGQERAPSAYLDDLFGGENGPPVPGHGRRGN
jgi:hypothetical protein